MFKLTILAAAIGTACTIPALAAEADNKPKQAYTFDEVVVSATRTEQSIKNLSSSIDSLSADDIETNMVQDMKEALQSEPGVTMEGQGRFGLSGFNIRGRNNDYVKVLIDGMQQPGIYNPGADVMRKNQNTIEIDTLQAVEVNKGPISSLYGSDAMGGAVIMRTKNPDDLIKDGETSYYSIKTGYASVDESMKTTASIANRMGDWETLLIYTYRDGHETEAHGDGAHVNGPDRGQADPFDIDSNNVLAKAFYQPNKAHRFGITYEYFNRDSTGDILSNEGRSINAGGMPLIIYADTQADDEEERQRVSFEHQWQANLAAFDKLQWQLGYQKSSADHTTYDVSTGMIGYGPRDRNRDGEDKSVQFNAQFDKSFEWATALHDMTYGLSYIQNKFDLNYSNYIYDTQTRTSGEPEVPKATSDTWGAFIQDQGYYLDERLIVTLGLRYDRFSSDPSGDNDYEKNTEDSVTGRIGTVYHWTDQWSTYAQVAQGFKAPTLFDLYYEYSVGAIWLPNPDLEAEESVGYEIGTRYANRFGRIELSAYYNDYKNFIENRQLGIDPDTDREISTNENIAKAKIYGVELKSRVDIGAFYQPLTGAYAELSAAYADGENKDDDSPIDSISPLTGYLALGYDRADARLGGKLSLVMTDKKSRSDWSNDDNPEVAGYAVTDMTAYYKPIENLTLRAAVRNIFDKQYWLYSNVDGLGMEGGTVSASGYDRYSEPGRNWRVEMEYVF